MSNVGTIFRCGFVPLQPLFGAARMHNLMERITVNPEQCGGRPCVRGMRIRVSDVIDLLANGLSSEQVVQELPDLELEDVYACLKYVSRRVSHPVLVP